MLWLVSCMARFAATALLNILSISMPNTFSMSPAYVKKYIEENRLIAPDQDVFECLRTKLARLYLDAIDGPDGRTFTRGCLVIADAGQD